MYPSTLSATHLVTTRSAHAALRSCYIPVFPSHIYLAFLCTTFLDLEPQTRRRVAFEDAAPSERPASIEEQELI